MRVIALDIGEKRCGVAISDTSATIASPLCVLNTTEFQSGSSPAFKRLLEDWEPELLICGLPKSLSGEEGQQANRIREIAQEIAQRNNLPLEFTDERLSSREAKQRLRDEGYDERTMRGKVDMVAASLFLQSWLDAQKHVDLNE